MAKNRSSAQRPAKRNASGPRALGASGRTTTATSRRPVLFAASGVVAVLVVAVIGFALISGGRGGGPTATVSPSAATMGTVVQGTGGTWTNISPDTLATLLTRKDFTLLNVKTPYIGEIDGTDLYIPYTDVAARAAELPADKAAEMVVYCRSGAESAIASQTLLGLGYTNILNLDGGMNAWTASGRQLVQKART